MIYFDTDVLVNAWVMQDPEKHRQSGELIEKAGGSDTAIISTLSVQEMLFVLDRLSVGAQQIQVAYEALMKLQPVAYGTENLRRAVDIAGIVGFRNINDCIHTAIAETHCTELVTYNGGDFNKIRNNARVAITVL